MAEDLDIPVKETVIPREMLYIVDEVFFCGHCGGDHPDPVGGSHHRGKRHGRTYYTKTAG